MYRLTDLSQEVLGPTLHLGDTGKRALLSLGGSEVRLTGICMGVVGIDGNLTSRWPAEDTRQVGFRLRIAFSSRAADAHPARRSSRLETQQGRS